MKPAAPDVLAVVLNWNNGEHTLRAVESLLASRGIRVDVRIVDNGSEDGSPEALESRFGRQRVLRLGENRGYTGGMNAGLAHWLEETASPLALIVTDDVTVTRDTVARMAATLEEEPSRGAVGPVVHHRTDVSRVFSAGGVIELGRARTRQVRQVIDPTAPYEVEWIDGCCMLLRREAIASVGLLDVRFFIYFEEVDLCCRLRAAGWSVAVEPRAKAYQEKDRIPTRYYAYYMTRNRFLFWRKNFGMGALRVGALTALDTAGLIAWWLRSLVQPSLRGERAVRAGWVWALLRWGPPGIWAHLRGRYGR